MAKVGGLMLVGMVGWVDGVRFVDSIPFGCAALPFVLLLYIHTSFTLHSLRFCFSLRLQISR